MPQLQHLFVVSAPSGGGKTTLNRRLVKEHPHIEVSVSLTTRKIRPGEVDGVHYHFVDRDEFERNIADGNMLEWANVHGNLYGTSKKELSNIAQRGHLALLEIDVQGWLKCQPSIKRATSIFILPPTMAVLWHRLKDRGTDSFEVRYRRMVNAKEEIGMADKYDHFIVNEDLEQAYRDLEGIIIRDEHRGLDPQQGQKHCHKLIEEFESQAFKRLLEQE